MLNDLYRLLTTLAEPLVPLWLAHRRRAGKENARRMAERFGVASLPRPPGKLVWIHGASVGESNAVLPLIDALLAANADISVLLTTVTVTSAALMEARLPARALHQFAPVDTPGAVRAFLAHWRPDIALWVDSELWPNLIEQTYQQGAVMGIVNARMSERSFRRWSRAPAFIRRLLACFTLCFAQSEADGERLRALGMPAITHVGNLKYDAPPPACDEAELARLKALAGARPLWLAACTHPGEEALIAEAHARLAAAGLAALTVIVPRHAARGDAIAAALPTLKLARRSRNEPILADTDMYLADTMGELGLFYRLCPVTFVGGSLVPHGGQNPIEAARLGSAVIVGPYTGNFTEVYDGFERDGACLRVASAAGLAHVLQELLPDRARIDALREHALKHVTTRAGVLHHIMKALQPSLA